MKTIIATQLKGSGYSLYTPSSIQLRSRVTLVAHPSSIHPRQATTLPLPPQDLPPGCLSPLLRNGTRDGRDFLQFRFFPKQCNAINQCAPTSHLTSPYSSSSSSPINPASSSSSSSEPRPARGSPSDSCTRQKSQKLCTIFYFYIYYANVLQHSVPLEHDIFI